MNVKMTIEFARISVKYLIEIRTTEIFRKK